MPKGDEVLWKLTTCYLPCESVRPTGQHRNASVEIIQRSFWSHFQLHNAGMTARLLLESSRRDLTLTLLKARHQITAQLNPKHPKTPRRFVGLAILQPRATSSHWAAARCLALLREKGSRQGWAGKHFLTLELFLEYELFLEMFGLGISVSACIHAMAAALLWALVSWMR